MLIYCVEDDDNIRELTVYALTSSGFEAKGFENATLFFDALKSSKPDMVILDIMLPDKDGIEILKTLRRGAETKRISVIMLSAKSTELDKIKGLDTGADDYITKPFGVMELVSRVKAVSRRTIVSENKITYKGIELDNLGRKVNVNGQEIILTHKEFELLYYLLNNKGIVLSRDKIMNEVWGFDFEGESRTIDVHIRTLRQKLGECGNVIETIRNVGYRI